MAFTRRTARARYRLPWSWSAFDYRELCDALWAQCGDARFETAKVERPRRRGTPTARSSCTPTAASSRAPLVVDALGWRRVLGRARTTSRRTRRSRAGSRSTRPRRQRRRARRLDRARRRARAATAGACRPDGEVRVGVGSYEPRDHVKEPTGELAARLDVEPLVGFQGNWFPHRAARRRARTACSSSATAPATASRSRARGSARRSTSASPPGASCARCSSGEQDRASARSRATPRSRRATRRTFAWALRAPAADPGAAAARADAGAAA